MPRFVHNNAHYWSVEKSEYPRGSFFYIYAPFLFFQELSPISFSLCILYGPHSPSSLWRNKSTMWKTRCAATVRWTSLSEIYRFHFESRLCLHQLLEDIPEGTWPPANLELNLGNWRLLSPSPVLGMYVLPTVPWREPFSRCWESKMWRPPGWYRGLSPVKDSI